MQEDCPGRQKWRLELLSELWGEDGGGRMNSGLLKHCPFCGGEAIPVYHENGNRYTSNIYYPSKRGTIKCKSCEITLPRVYSRVSKAVEVWNRRVIET